jgi:membrane protein implicated in regulation of membrane protease activity
VARRRRVSPAVLRLVLLGGVLFLSLFAAGAAVISFLLMRAGYGFAVWGVLPFLALVIVAVVFGAAVWRLTRSQPSDHPRPGGPEEKPREGSRRGGSRGGDDV